VGLQIGDELHQVPSRRQRRDTPYSVSHSPYPLGRVPPGASVGVRHRIPSMRCRFIHIGGRPGFLPTGGSGSDFAIARSSDRLASRRGSRHVKIHF
jgi:hypothetical protein